MTTPNFIDQIPDYFAGELSPAERQAFEQALDKNVDLKEAVTIWHEMDEVLAPAPEDKLLENLQRVRAEAAPPKGPPSANWFKGWWVPMLLLGGVLLWMILPKALAPAATDSIPANPALPDSLTTNQSMPASTDTITVELDTIKREAPSSRPPENKITPRLDPPEEEDPSPAPQVFAANFDPNPLLETEMRDQLRGGAIEFSLDGAIAEKLLDSSSEAVTFSLNGSLVTDLTKDEISLRILLLTNKVEDYQYSRFLSTLPVSLQATKDGFNAEVSSKIDLLPGLYYYLLEWEEEETYLHIGRFSVK